MVSHLVGYWIKLQPIGQALGEVLDGGELLSDAFQHPLRPPKLHLPADVARLHVALREGIKAASTAGEAREIDLFRSDIERLAAVLELAAARGEAVISVLEPPFDEERAAKVRIPFAGERSGE
jgi:hypothetical protein